MRRDGDRREVLRTNLLQARDPHVTESMVSKGRFEHAAYAVRNIDVLLVHAHARASRRHDVARIISILVQNFRMLQRDRRSLRRIHVHPHKPGKHLAKIQNPLALRTAAHLLDRKLAFPHHRLAKLRHQVVISKRPDFHLFPVIRTPLSHVTFCNRALLRHIASIPVFVRVIFRLVPPFANLVGVIFFPGK